MKILIYFLLWSLSMCVTIFLTIILIKLLVKLILYFEKNSLIWKLTDFIDALKIGGVMGLFLGAVICLVNYLEHKRH
ncbi:hypothetical protein BN1805_02446 [Proteus vulgaris]|nr:hypothetical protein BN1805_02446 [Proteus vulgaris]